MMKIRQNGEAQGLLCGVEGCNVTYADVFSDRMLVYSFHYGRTHSTSMDANHFRAISGYIRDGTPATMQCVCGLLNCATVGTSQIVFESKHRTEAGKGGEVHQNSLDLEEIESISAWFEKNRNSGTVSSVEFDLDEVRQAS